MIHGTPGGGCRALPRLKYSKTPIFLTSARIVSQFDFDGVVAVTTTHIAPAFTAASSTAIVFDSSRTTAGSPGVFGGLLSVRSQSKARTVSLACRSPSHR